MRGSHHCVDGAQRATSHTRKAEPNHRLQLCSPWLLRQCPLQRIADRSDASDSAEPASDGPGRPSSSVDGHVLTGTEQGMRITTFRSERMMVLRNGLPSSLPPRTAFHLALVPREVPGLNTGGPMWGELLLRAKLLLRVMVVVVLVRVVLLRRHPALMPNLLLLIALLGIVVLVL